MSVFGAARMRAGPLRESLADIALAVGGAALSLAAGAGQVVDTLRGGFVDPDDAMRLAEVRAWLAGQPWFDMNAQRLDPPVGSILHWSRLVDLPTAGAIWMFGLFVEPATAERLAAVAVPGFWLVLLFAGMLTASQLQSGVVDNVGSGYELVAIAAVIIGGTLLTGGSGSVIGTASGVLLLLVIQNLIGHHFSQSTAASQAVNGGFLAVVALLQTLLTRRRRLA